MYLRWVWVVCETPCQGVSTACVPGGAMEIGACCRDVPVGCLRRLRRVYRGRARSWRGWGSRRTC